MIILITEVNRKLVVATTRDYHPDVKIGTKITLPKAMFSPAVKEDDLYRLNLEYCGFRSDAPIGPRLIKNGSTGA